MIKRSKEEARPAMIEMFLKSWTYARLTPEEKNDIIKQLAMATIKGTFKQRCEQLHNVYSNFLDSVGYRPCGWREPQSETEPQF